MSDLEDPPWGFVFGSPWENPAWDSFVEKYPKELEPEWEDTSCPLVTMETNPDLYPPIQASNRYAEIASVFHAHSASSLGAYCILGDCRYGLVGGSQDEERGFEVQAKRAALVMGNRGSDHLRFFFHHLRLWYCATAQNVGGFDYPKVGAITSWKVRDGHAYKEHDAYMEISKIFKVAADFCWELETRFMAVTNADELGIEKQKSARISVSRPSIRKRRSLVLSDHEKGIRKIIREGVVGKRYAERLTEIGIIPIEAWIKNGCAKSYRLAFEDVYWREQLQKEKSRVKRRMSIQSFDKKKSKKFSASPPITRTAIHSSGESNKE